MRSTYTLVGEPKLDVLERLLRWLSGRCVHALVVVRDEIELGGHGHDLLSRLLPYTVERRRGSRWPGTTLLEGAATVITFSANADTLNHLIQASAGLYGWRQPELPEDLAFLRSEGEAMLACISHERDAYMVLTDVEHAELCEQIPELAGVMVLQPCE